MRIAFGGAWSRMGAGAGRVLAAAAAGTAAAAALARATCGMVDAVSGTPHGDPGVVQLPDRFIDASSYGGSHDICAVHTRRGTLSAARAARTVRSVSGAMAPSHRRYGRTWSVGGGFLEHDPHQHCAALALNDARHCTPCSMPGGSGKCATSSGTAPGGRSVGWPLRGMEVVRTFS